METGELAGRPDLQRKIRDIVTQLAPRVSAVEDEFSNRYNWTRNRNLNSTYENTEALAPQSLRLQDEALGAVTPAAKGPESTQRQASGANTEVISVDGQQAKQGNQIVTEQQRQSWREANKEKIAEKDKAYREANKEEIAEKHKAWREANKDKIAEKQKAYCEANKDKKKAYREANKSKRIEELKQIIEPHTDNEWIYVLQCGLYNKIGFSKDPLRRIPEIERKTGFGIELLYLAKANYGRTVDTENIIHHDLKHLNIPIPYKSKTVSREWFYGDLSEMIEVIGKYTEIKKVN